MKQALDTRTKLLTKNPWPLMIELSIPAVLGMVVVGLYNMMDSIFVGQMVGDVQMGAISVSYPLTLINAGSAAMLGVGSASVLSRAIGKKDENTIKKIMGNLVAMVLLLSVIYTVVGMVFTRQLLSLTGASDNILNYAEKYLRIVFAGSLFVNFFQSANMVIRGEGQLKRAMTIIASGAILNIILDPIFISILNPYGMGIEAAAYATIFSQFVQAAITLWYFKKKSPHVKIGRIRIDGELLPQVLSVGISALLMQILTLVQQTVIYRVASNYGGETSQLLLAAALRFWNFSFVPLWGISQGFQPAAGTNYGAKDYDRVKTLTRVFIIAATLLSLVFYIPAELFPEKILSMFLTTPGIAASGSTNFRIMFSTYIQNLRKDREVTQEQLAIDLNISDRYMRNLEKGEKVPSVDLFVELRERFGSSLDYIVLGVSASQREQELQDQLQMLRKELKEMQRRILVMLEMLGESA